MTGRLHAQGARCNASNARRMAEFIAFIPTLCAVSLVVFGLGGYQPTLPIVLWTVAGAIMGGPVAVNLFGFGGWLILVVAGTLACTAYAAGRRSHVQHQPYQR
jgi:hypothetical protein